MPAADIVDAEFETLRPDPIGRASRLPPMAIGRQQHHHKAWTRCASKVRLRRKGRSRGGPMFWIVGLGLAAGAFWVSGGHALVRQTSFMAAAPQVQPANPLRISDVTSRIEDHGGRMVLFVDGKAINGGNEQRALPLIEISVTANDGGVMRYNLGTSQDPLAAGGEFGFSSRLEAPKEGVKSVSVTFRE